MNFRLTTLLYVFALLAAAMATFGAGGGLAAALLVGGFHHGWSISKEWGLSNIELGTILVATAILVALLLPEVQGSHSSSSRQQSLNQIKQLGLAMHSYHDVHGHFPPPYTTDDQGNPLHSWRTLLLPYIEEQALFDKINFDEPWNSPANGKLLEDLQIDVLQSPREPARDAGPAETHYFAIVGDETVWQPDARTSFADVKDGSQTTIVLMEVAGLGIPWYEPRDPTIEEAIDLLCGDIEEKLVWIRPGIFVSERFRSGGLYGRAVSFADGSARSVGRCRERESASALLTRAGVEELCDQDYDWEVSDALIIGHVIHWGRIWGLAVFVVLAVAPLFKKQSASDEALLVG